MTLLVRVSPYMIDPQCIEVPSTAGSSLDHYSSAMLRSVLHGSILILLDDGCTRSHRIHFQPCAIGDSDKAVECLFGRIVVNSTLLSCGDDMTKLKTTGITVRL